MWCDCPVCGYPDLDEPPRFLDGNPSQEICRSCGFQFGYSDDSEGIPYEEYRRRWIERGMPWSGVNVPPPAGWDPVKQMRRAKIPIKMSARDSEKLARTWCNCPVCGYVDFDEPPRSSAGAFLPKTCRSCGYNVEMAGLSFAKYRERWIERGMPWSAADVSPPTGWDPVRQLRRAKLPVKASGAADSQAELDEARRHRSD